MSARGKARKRALDVLYEADIRGTSPADVLSTTIATIAVPLNPYTFELVDGVLLHQQQIDELLSEYSFGWTLERMPAIDRNVLRLGAWELIWGDVPPAVAISEAVNLVKALSTEESAGFVNGLLARLLEIRPGLQVD
ncbi:MAG: transcription antitermination factor NusB [Actinomycetes bacterium]